MKKTVSVIGSCVCRDLFMGDKENFEYRTDIRFSSPISMLAKPVDFIHIDFEHLTKKAMDVNGNWFKKTLINDINKTAFEALQEKHGDYLIVDMVEARMNLATIHWPNQDNSLIVSNSGLFRKHYRYNLSKNIMKGTNLEITRVASLSDEYWERIIKEYSQKILSLFKESNIIMIRNMPASYYLDQNRCLKHYTAPSHCSEIFECQLLLPKLYDYFLKYCPNINVIDIPKFAIGDSNHIWKTNPFHFTNRYYEYLYKCVNAILEGNKSDLSALYNNYEKLFYEDYVAGMNSQINSFYSSTTTKINYNEIIEEIEEFKPLGRKKRLMMLLACSKKDFFKTLKNIRKK